jgi:hypothetical protein
LDVNSDEENFFIQAYSSCAPCVGSEVNVTGRKDRSGNFGGKIDELVKHFPNERPAARRQKEKTPRQPDERHINDRLFESSWRKSREP